MKETSPIPVTSPCRSLMNQLCFVRRVPREVPAGRLKSREYGVNDACTDQRMRPIPNERENSRVATASFFSSAFSSTGTVFVSTF